MDLKYNPQARQNGHNDNKNDSNRSSAPPSTQNKEAEKQKNDEINRLITSILPTSIIDETTLTNLIHDAKKRHHNNATPEDIAQSAVALYFDRTSQPPPPPPSSSSHHTALNNLNQRIITNKNATTTTRVTTTTTTKHKKRSRQTSLLKYEGYDACGRIKRRKIQKSIWEFGTTTPSSSSHPTTVTSSTPPSVNHDDRKVTINVGDKAGTDDSNNTTTTMIQTNLIKSENTVTGNDKIVLDDRGTTATTCHSSDEVLSKTRIKKESGDQHSDAETTTTTTTQQSHFCDKKNTEIKGKITTMTLHGVEKREVIENKQDCHHVVEVVNLINDTDEDEDDNNDGNHQNSFPSTNSPLIRCTINVKASSSHVEACQSSWGFNEETINDSQTSTSTKMTTVANSDEGKNKTSLSLQSNRRHNVILKNETKYDDTASNVRNNIDDNDTTTTTTTRGNQTNDSFTTKNDNDIKRSIGSTTTTTTTTSPIHRDVLSPSFSAISLATQWHSQQQQQQTSKILSSPPFADIAHALSQISSTTKRNEKERGLTNILLALLYYYYVEMNNSSNDDKNDKQQQQQQQSTSLSSSSLNLITETILLIGNAYEKVSSSQKKLILHIGPSILSSSICSTLSCPKSQLRQLSRRYGELGDAAAAVLLEEESGGGVGGSGGRCLRQTRLTFQPKNQSQIKKIAVEVLTIADVMSTIRTLAGLTTTANDDDDDNKGSGNNNSTATNKRRIVRTGIETQRKQIITDLLSRAASHAADSTTASNENHHNPSSSAAAANSLRFIIRILSNQLRIGATLLTVTKCLVRAHVLYTHNQTQHDSHHHSGRLTTSPPTLKKGEIITTMISTLQADFRHAVDVCVDYRTCLRALMEGGSEALRLVNARVGIPVQPLLGAPCRSVDEAVRHYRSFADEHQQQQQEEEGETFMVAAEYKYDGQRAQIHWTMGDEGDDGDDGKMIVYSRHLDDMTVAFKEGVVDWFLMKRKEKTKAMTKKNTVKLSSFIIDAEIVPVKIISSSSSSSRTDDDDESQQKIKTVILPFQVLSGLKKSIGGTVDRHHHGRKQHHQSSATSTMIQQQGDNNFSSSSSSTNEIRVCTILFDILSLNDKPLLSLPYSSRRQILHDTFSHLIEPGRLEFAHYVDIPFSSTPNTTANNNNNPPSSPSHLSSSTTPAPAPPPDTTTTITNQITTILHQSITSRCEGLMLKSHTSLYNPTPSRDVGGGGGGWRKLKKDYVDTLSDSFDVIPIGAWRGHGRKANWFSPFLLAVRDVDEESGEVSLRSFCRCMSGFDDEFYRDKTKFYEGRLRGDIEDDKMIEDDDDGGLLVCSDETPPYWFHPCEVWEIRGADLTLSPVHHAAKHLMEEEAAMMMNNGDVDDEEEVRGISLRFPRFVRVREDKGLEEATSSWQVLQMFHAQAQRM